MSAKKIKKRKFGVIRRILRVFFGLLLFLLGVILFIRSPWGQQFIVNKAVSYVADKTKTKVGIDKLFLTFDGALQIEGLFLADTKGDTLLYSKSLEANLPLLAMIKGDAVGVDDLKWEGVRANIIRKDTISGYNFKFIRDVFASEDKTPIAKDTISKPLNIVLGSINLKDIHVVFKDAVLGINSSYRIEDAAVEMEKVDLEKMIFSADAISMSNAIIKVVQKPVAAKKASDATEEIVLPLLSANSIALKEVHLYYESTNDKTIADLELNDFYTEIPEINLKENLFRFHTIELKNSTIVLKTSSKSASKNQEVHNLQSSSQILWPNITLAINEINLENNAVGYFVDEVPSEKNKINPNAILLEHLNLKISALFLKDKKAGLEMKEFNFQEKSGFKLHNFAFNAAISDHALAISKMNIKLDKSNLAGFVKVQYKSLSQLISAPENTNVQLKVSSFQIWLADFFQFQPSVQKNEYLNKLSKKKLTGAIDLEGSLAAMTISDTHVNWGKATKIAVSGVLKNVAKPDQLFLDIPYYKATTKRADLVQIVTEKKLNIQLPEEILVTGNVKGSLNALAIATKIKTPLGSANIIGTFKNNESMRYEVAIDIDTFNVGTFLKNPTLGVLSAAVTSKGSGKTIHNLDASLSATISKFELDTYAIKDLDLNGTIKNGKGVIAATYKDENLNIKLKALVALDAIASQVNLNLEVIGADLKGLGVMNRPVKTGMDIALDFKGNATKYTIDTAIKNGVFIYDNKTYLVGLLRGTAFVDTDTTAVTIKNKLIHVALESNTDPETFSNAIQRHISSYFYRDTQVSDTITHPVILKLNGKIAQTPLIKEVFLMNVKDIDTIHIAVDFNEKQRKLKANITAPHINYNNNELDSLSFSINTDRDNFNFNVGFTNIIAGPLNIPKTLVTGNQNNNELSLVFSSIHKDKKLVHINTKITGASDRLVFSVHPDSLILNKRKWTIPADNEIILKNNKLEFNNFKIAKNSQSIEITDKLNSITKDHIAIDYKNFKIGELFKYLNPAIEIAKGSLNGHFILEEPFENTGIIANLTVSELEVLKTDFGTLKMDAKSLGENKYDFGAKLSGGDADLKLQGDYDVTNNDANLAIDLLINEFKMNALNTLSLGEIKEASGSFSGDFKVSGTTSQPIYNGKIQFNNSAFKVTKLNTKFTLPNETLRVDNSGLLMSKFTILDAKKNSLVLSGSIKTKSFINPTFNLDIKAKNFRVLNATKKENETLYGKVAFNADAKLTGSLRIPKLNAQLTVSPETEVTYVLPASYANVEERDGVVLFVNRENPTAILTQTEAEVATITGFDIFAKLKIDKQAAVTISIDEETGDNFKVSGDGDLVFTMLPNGSVSLTGVYEVADGHYELSLYNLVNRRFSLAKGSRISWFGDPLEAKLEVSAIYKLTTSALPLMASQISGEDTATRNKYKQELPFYVYLNIDGDLLQPKISFNLEMPEEAQGAIGGQVYSRVQQVNKQEDELNKQVFSALVLNRFYPDAGSDGSSGGFASIARANLNDAVSGQLNAFSDKILGSSGVELDFGLNSFTDYQGDSGPTDRTQLDIAAQKKLFNDRLLVSVGSEVDIQGSSPNGEKTPLIGNVSLEYRITEDGRYSVRGFRKSEFENVIDGQTIVSGIALIFTREFNEFKQLWDAIFRLQKEKEKEKEEEKEKEKEAAAKLLEKEQETPEEIAAKTNNNTSIKKEKN
ncbi:MULTISPECIES: translocation/assembly module TamB domain-containing protein [unclassified Polaribacter]|uniref:translocation/assembly module TamB domain-containing protein n=1 Tax=unclassified Polaribacter TaxID=196858 RepID=UPI0011BEC59F|nr:MULTISPECIES: translocation/assembly module TamB domain-containing protein [unclassified Polaribacter]TXD51145.1 translocation/assembly module TamB [Polaribacter sp. IC063]TXD56762.1 translocation/assembly module TamB [Polaribacter sp. IC066]